LHKVHLLPTAGEFWYEIENSLSQPQINAINAYIDSNFKFVETIQSPQPYFGTFNCHFFAWHNNQGYTIWNNSGNIWQNGTPPEYVSVCDPMDYTSDGSYSNPSGYASYEQTTDSDAPIAIYKLNGTIMHSARRLSGSTELISKWGPWGVYKHSPTDVPSIYGSITEKYKINPHYRPIGSGDPGGRNWGTISNALIGIPSASAITVLSGTQTLSGDISVPSGVTLKIKLGATINLNSKNIFISSGGAFINQGTLTGLKATLTRNGELRGLCSTVQVAVNAITDLDNGNTYELAMANGTFTENLNISNKYGLYFHGNGSTTINGNVNISNCESGIFNSFNANALSLTGCAVPQLSNINLDPCSGNQCLYAYNCSYLYFFGGSISDRNAYMYGTGFNFYQTSNATINENAGTTLIYHNVRGVLAQGSAMNISNVHFCNNTYDLVTTSGGFIRADDCFFPGGVPHTQGSNIYTGSPQISNCAGLPKSSVSLSKSIVDTSDASSDEFMQINMNNFTLSEKVRADISDKRIFDKSKYSSDCLKIINDCRGFINKYPGSEYSRTALVSIVHLYKMLSDYEGMNVFLQEIIADKNLTKESGWAKRFMLEYYRYNKDFTAAFATAEEIMKERADDKDLLCNVLFAEGLLYAHDLNNPESASAYFLNIVDNYSDNSLAEFAENELEMLGIKPKEIPKENQAIESVEFNAGNYPNPFNPSTTISYTLPEEGRVQIKVFDALGREVRTLLDEVVGSGRHSIYWNGNNSASGIYFYSISFKGQTLYKKMILMK
jgi:hypothetical protein